MRMKILVARLTLQNKCQRQLSREQPGAGGGGCQAGSYEKTFETFIQTQSWDIEHIAIDKLSVTQLRFFKLILSELSLSLVLLELYSP